MECPICYDDMQHKSKFTGTCFHQWCMECHRRKIKYDKLCPLCRCSHANLMEPNFDLSNVEYFLEFNCNGVLQYARPWRIKRRLRRRMRALRGT